MNFKVDYRMDKSAIIQAEDAIEAENKIHLQHPNCTVTETTLVAVNGRDEVFVVGDAVRADIVPEAAGYVWTIDSIGDSDVKLSRLNSSGFSHSYIEVPQSIIEKAW